MKFLSAVYFLIFYFAISSFAQEITSLRGKVLDIDGNPIESEHVRNMSNNTGVIS